MRTTAITANGCHDCPLKTHVSEFDVKDFIHTRWVPVCVLTEKSVLTADDGHYFDADCPMKEV